MYRISVDSPKFRNKGNTSARNVRINSLESNKRPTVVNKRIISTHNIVVVRAANKEAGMEKDPDIQRLQVSFIMQIVFNRLNEPFTHFIKPHDQQ